MDTHLRPQETHGRNYYGSGASRMVMAYLAASSRFRISVFSYTFPSVPTISNPAEFDPRLQTSSEVKSLSFASA